MILLDLWMESYQNQDLFIARVVSSIHMNIPNTRIFIIFQCGEWPDRNPDYKQPNDDGDCFV